MAIIKPGLSKLPSKTFKIVKSENITPLFVPALDLLEQLRKQLTTDEVIVIGAALLNLLNQDTNDQSSWQRIARFESINNRL